MNQGQDFCHLLRSHSTFVNSLLKQRFCVRLTLFCGFQTNVFKHDLNPHHGRGISDPLPHHTRAQHTNLLGFLWGNVFGTRGTTIDLVHLEEERIDHVLSLGRKRKLGQTPALDTHRRFEIDRKRLHSHVKNLFGSGKQTARILSNHGCAHGHHLSNLGITNITAGDLVTLCVPWLSSRRLIIFVIQHPLLGDSKQFVLGIDNGVNQTRPQCLFRRNTLALNDIFVCRHEPHEVNRLDVTATTGKKAQSDFRKAKLHAAMVPRNPVMT